MKLFELKHYARRAVRAEEDKGGVSHGTYIGIHYDEETKDRIRQLIQDESIPNPLKPENLHTTVVYSKKELPEFEPMGDFEKPVRATIAGFDIFTGQEGNKCLVAKLDAPYCVSRHNLAKEKHGATYDYDEYIPHLTLSYNVDDNIDLDKLTKKYKGLKLTAKDEYAQPLENDWAKKQGEL